MEIREWAPGELGVALESVAPLAQAVGPFAVVDLETTGLQTDPAAEILEFGLVLVDATRDVVTTLRTLVRPSAPLPRPIQRLTGLTDAQVASAPAVAEVRQAVADALEGRALVAHNAAFERHFLTRDVAASLRHAEYLDTQDLLALTHPDAPDLRLESFTRELLGTEERHRALDDALDTLRVLSAVGSQAQNGFPRAVRARRALERYAPDSPWLALLGKDLLVEEPSRPSQYVEIGPSAEAPVPFDEDAIAEALADAERGARYFPGYRVRGEQIELARHFVRTLADGGVLLLEGGTGVGKSLAYLAAAIPFAMERAAGGNHEPVIVSTRTKLLQDQLLSRDIEATARFLGYPELHALSIKGRANYVCQRRLERVLDEGREPSIFAEDRLAYAVLLACAETRRHGEVGTLPAALLRRYPALRELRRRAVAARAEQCSREQCAKQPGCPFGRRRQALGRAHLVVANHDLLLRWPPDYPAFTHTIADEVHELTGVADEVYAVEVRPEDVLDRVDELFGRPSETGRSDALLPARVRRPVQKDVRSARRALQQDFTALGRLLSERASEYGELQLPPHADRLFAEAASLADVSASRLDALAATARKLDPGGEDDEESAVERHTLELAAAALALRRAFHSPPEEAVAAFESLLPPFERWRLVIRAVSPAGPFHEQFLDRMESFAGVSASLFVGGDPFAALGELEIEGRPDEPLPVGPTHRLERVSVPSPFPYAEHMRVVALKSEGDLVEQTAATIADLARALGGRTLALFTSLRRMNQVAEILAESLRDEGFDILAPRRATDDPAALVERFRKTRGGGVLLGARTFWQGLDIPGADLQAVVIEKLPFEVPTELRKRREERLRAAGEDPFTRSSLGKMLLNLKQMVGRLVRTEDDRGLVVIVEGRHDRRYFRSLAKALPEGVAIRVVPRQSLPGVLAEIGLGTDPPSQLH
ncbi:MAG: hypothetical protein MJE66_14465 [Proteobacteria bacterium]|nr:hypothetical protein [Pseudomonadota bacterium]